MNSKCASASIPAFSLVEMVGVLAILAILLTAGVALLADTGNLARQVGAEQLTSMVEQARTFAISKHTHVVLALAEPGDLPEKTEPYCQLALFSVSEWPEEISSTPIKANQLARWRALEKGAVLLAGQIPGSGNSPLINPLDEDKLALSYGSETQPRGLSIHALAINPHGRLVFPEGSDPALLRLAAGTYKNGQAIASQRSGRFNETFLKISRSLARPLRLDG